MAGPNVLTAQFATDDFPARERITAWREFFGRGIVNLDIAPLTASDEEFRSEAKLTALPGLGLVRGSSSAACFDRPAHMIDGDDFALAASLAGEFNVGVGNRTCTVRTGGAVLMGGGHGGYCAWPGQGRFFSLRIPMHSLSAAVPGWDAAIARPIPAQTPALSMLFHYIGVLDDKPAMATPELQRLAVTHIHDLVALAVGATRDATEIASGRGLRAGRLKAIKDDIAANLDDETLSVGAIALRHQVTPRYVQKLFDAEGVTFTEYVMTQRLARAHRMLGDPRQAERTISAIAFDVGFGDLSYFYRSFRRQYGATPSDVRAQAHVVH